MLYAAAAVERPMKIQQVIVRALSGGITWLQAADILGVDPRSVWRWRARYEAGGPVALYARRRVGPARRQAPALWQRVCWGGQRLRMGDYVAGTGPRGAADAAGEC